MAKNPTGKVSERTSAFESKPDKIVTEKLSPGPTLKRSESNLTSDMQKKYQVSLKYFNCNGFQKDILGTGG